MAIKPVLASLDGLSEEMQALYGKQGDVYVLDFGGDDLGDHPTVTALKNSMANSKRERTEARDALKALETKFGDLDPETARAALQAMQDLKDKKLLDDGDVEELVLQRTERVRSDFESQTTAKNDRISELEAFLQTSDNRLADMTIFTEIERAAIEAGVRDTALDDVKNRARAVWQLKDGKPVAMKNETEIQYGKNGDPLSVGEWVGDLAAGAEHLFKPSGGGGSGGGEDRTSRGGPIPTVSRDKAGDFLEKIASGEMLVSD